MALLAAGAGISVAGLYYNQPILGAIASDLGATPARIGIVPMITQLGYGVGILLFAPVGDRFERRSVIVAKLAGLGIALVGAGLATSPFGLAAASLLVGLLATTAQDFVPVAAALAPAAARGKTVGSVMTGLLLGILLSRLVSGAAGERFGWRVVFFGAAGTVALLAVVARARLPRVEAGTRAGYFVLLRSIGALARDVAPLRRAALTQGLLSLGFSAFWSTLALALAEEPYRLKSAAAGAFGLAGAAGALVAPLAGTIADRRGPRLVIRAGACLVLASFLMMAAVRGSLVVLVIGTVAFDLGLQACLISHQTIVYSLEPTARSRLNAVLLSSMFFAMSAGAAVDSWALAHHGWFGVMLLASLSACLAVGVAFLPDRAALPISARPT